MRVLYVGETSTSQAAGAIPCQIGITGGQGEKTIMRFGIIGTVSFLFLAMLLPGLAGATTPSDYDGCILESMKGVKSDLAAKSIIRSCRNKFPDTPNRIKKIEPLSIPDIPALVTIPDRPNRTMEFRSLSIEETSQLVGKIRFRGRSLFGNFSCRIYNGNENITVSEITIRITTKVDGKDATMVYKNDVNIGPQTAVSFGLEALEGDKDADYSWSIESAKGY